MGGQIAASADYARMNRLVWIVVFALGTVTFALIEWRSGNASAMDWFIGTSIWSALCAIGFTVCEWAAARGP